MLGMCKLGRFSIAQFLFLNVFCSSPFTPAPSAVGRRHREPAHARGWPRDALLFQNSFFLQQYDCGLDLIYFIKATFQYENN